MRFFLKLGAALGSLVTGSVALYFWLCPTPQAMKNVLVVSIDTLRADHLSCYGYPKNTTPSLDALASRGHRFARAYAAMPTTLPSHVAMMTGLHPSALGVTRNGLVVSDEAITLAEILRERGFRTAAFVAAAPLAQETNFDQGFDSYRLVDGRASEVLKEASRWLLQDQNQGPFFLFVHLFDPHTPYHAPEEFARAWGAPIVAGPKRFEFLEDPHLLSQQDINEGKASYVAEVAYVDHELGHFLQTVKPALANALTVVTSDHGESLDELFSAESYVFDHGEFLRAHQLLVPLIISEPQQSRGQVHVQPVSTVSLAPTILEILGLPLHLLASGAAPSLLPIMRGASSSPEPVFAQRRTFSGPPPRPFLQGRAVSAIRDDIQFVVDTIRGQAVYDLRRDPTGMIPQEKPLSPSPPRLMRFLNELEQLQSHDKTKEVDAELQEQLKALGYVR